MARSVAVCLAVLLALFEVGSCVRCFQCNSQSDRTCADTYSKPASHMVDCSTQDTVNYNQQYLYNILPPETFGSVAGAPRYCHKIVMESGTVIRSCLDGNPTDMNHTCRVMERATALVTADKKIKYCSACDKDDCNGAGTLNFSLPLAVAALFASYLLYKQ